MCHAALRRNRCLRNNRTWTRCRLHLSGQYRDVSITGAIHQRSETVYPQSVVASYLTKAEPRIANGVYDFAQLRHDG